jgi:hypothetical protein
MTFPCVYLEGWGSHAACEEDLGCCWRLELAALKNYRHRNLVGVRAKKEVSLNLQTYCV